MTTTKEHVSERSLVDLLPVSWPKIKAKFLFRERKGLSEDGSEELLSASHITGITKRSEKDVGMFLAETNEGYKIVNLHDVVINTMWAWMGAMGVSFIDGIISPSYGIYQPITQKTDPKYFDYLLRSVPFITDVNRRSKGVWSSRLRLYPDDFLSMPLPIPEISKQKEIAEFLVHETANIDQVIDKKQKFLAQLGARIEALVDEATSSSNTHFVRFEYTTHRIFRPVNLAEHEELVRLGLYNRGRGLFKKPSADEEGMGDSDFCFVKNGDLILSGQFAWEGAVALATPAEDGCVVSHRYPVYRARKGIETAYLLALLRSRYGDFILNELSKGSAGRNRPLNTWRLGKEKIPVPEVALQLAIKHAVELEMRLREMGDTSISRLREYRAALITSAVTGQIDVSKWRQRDVTERQIINKAAPSDKRRKANA